jgi:hypothetical protein
MFVQIVFLLLAKIVRDEVNQKCCLLPGVAVNGFSPLNAQLIKLILSIK